MQKKDGNPPVMTDRALLGSISTFGHLHLSRANKGEHREGYNKEADELCVVHRKLFKFFSKNVREIKGVVVGEHTFNLHFLELVDPHRVKAELFIIHDSIFAVAH